MMKNREGISRMGCRLIALAGLVVALGLGMHPTQAWAVVCAAVLAAPNPGATGPDFDGDGFTDFQECSGITLAGGLSVPSCVSATTLVPPFPNRAGCLDPNSKDLFVIYKPLPSGSLLPPNYKPFETVTLYGVTFRGLNDLLVTVHQIAPEQALPDRTVTLVSPQKAVMVAEDPDPTGTILGDCQWGTPMGEDGCSIFTKRISDFIDSTCGAFTIVTATGGSSSRDDFFKAYTTYLFLHETAHSIGGLTAAFNSRTGGYHYKPGAGFIMEQAVTSSAKAGFCRFYISPVWNAVDTPAVKLK